MSAGGGGPKLTPEEELRVLFPDVDVTVRDPDTGKPLTLTVREFRFREGLEAQAEGRPLLEALADVYDDEDAAPDAAAIDAVLGAHSDLWLALIARAIGRDQDWLGRLGDDDGSALGDAMWSANSGFFRKRVVAAIMQRRATREANGSRSAPSSTPSSGPATGEATPS